MFDIILALVALGLLVTVHETGHFIAARLCGVKVEKFSIGFGKPLLKFTRKDIEYCIGWLPLGGYVKMKGEAIEEDAPEEADSFQFTKWWKKIIISVAGPLFNLILAVLIFILSFMLPGKIEDQYAVVGQATGTYSHIFAPGDSIISVNEKPVQGWYHFLVSLNPLQPNSIVVQRNGKSHAIKLDNALLEELSANVLPAVSSTIGEVNPGMPAWRAGLQPGDKIIKVDSVLVTDWYQMREIITGSGRETVNLTLQRKGKLFDKVLALEQNPLADGQRLIGITQAMPVVYKQSNAPLKAMEYGVVATANFIVINYVGLYRIISRPETIKNSVGGPVMIYSLSSQSARKGWTSWLMFVAAISLVLMIMNLLPIPVLDGGHIMFALIQAVTGKPLPHKLQILLQNIGFILLLMLMAYAFYNDFTKVFSRAMSTTIQP